MQNFTLKDMVDVFRTFATNHKQINSFFSGTMDDFQAQQNIYTSMVIFPTSSTIHNGETLISFGVIVADILTDSTSNLDFVFSNTLSILQDLFAYLYQNENDLNYSIDSNGFSATPFSDMTTDILAGHWAELTISIPFFGNSCDIPID